MCEDKVGKQMVPAVTGFMEQVPAFAAMAGIVGGQLGGIALAAAFDDRLQNAPVETIQNKLIADLLVVLVT